MSSSEGTEARRPLKTAGSVLLGSAVVAAMIGVVIAATSDEQDAADSTRGSIQAGQSAPPVTPTPEPTSATPSSVAPTSTEPTRTETAPTTTTGTTPAAPGSAPARPPGQAGPAPVPGAPDAANSGSSGHRAEQQRPRGQLRVYNNSTITGLATRAADDFTAAGWTVTEVANYSAGRIPTTTVYYREGTGERPVAEALAAEFGLRAEPRFAGIADADPGVIVIVTKDYRA